MVNALRSRLSEGSRGPDQPCPKHVRRVHQDVT